MAKTKYRTVLETSKELRVSERTVREWIKNGELKAVRIGGRIIRIPSAELERLACCK